MPEVTRVRAKSKEVPADPELLIEDVEFDDSDGIKVLLYGRPKTGKTRFWSTFPTPILSVICSGGNRPGELRSIPKKLREGIKKHTLVESNKLFDIVKLVEREGYKTLVIDHLTGLEDLILKECLGLDEIPRQRSWGIADKQVYGQRANQCKELAYRIMGLKCNIVFVAQEKVTEIEGAAEFIKPSVGPKVGDAFGDFIYPAADYTLQTFIQQRMKKVKEVKTNKKGEKVTTWKEEPDPDGGIDYCVRTGKHLTFLTGFREEGTIKLPPYLVVTNRFDTYDRLKRLIDGKPDEAK